MARTPKGDSQEIVKNNQQNMTDHRTMSLFWSSSSQLSHCSMAGGVWYVLGACTGHDMNLHFYKLGLR